MNGADIAWLIAGCSLIVITAIIATAVVLIQGRGRW